MKICLQKCRYFSTDFGWAWNLGVFWQINFLNLWHCQETINSLKIPTPTPAPDRGGPVALFFRSVAAGGAADEYFAIFSASLDTHALRTTEFLVSVTECFKHHGMELLQKRISSACVITCWGRSRLVSMLPL